MTSIETGGVGAPSGIARPSISSVSFTPQVNVSVPSQRAALPTKGSDTAPLAKSGISPRAAVKSVPSSAATEIRRLARRCSSDGRPVFGGGVHTSGGRQSGGVTAASVWVEATRDVALQYAHLARRAPASTSSGAPHRLHRISTGAGWHEATGGGPEEVRGWLG